MRLDRRGFFGALFAATAAPAVDIPPIANEEIGPGKLEPTAGVDSYTYRLVSYGALMCESPGWNGRVSLFDD